MRHIARSPRIFCIVFLLLLTACGTNDMSGLYHGNEGTTIQFKGRTATFTNYAGYGYTAELRYYFRLSDEKISFNLDSQIMGPLADLANVASEREAKFIKRDNVVVYFILDGEEFVKEGVDFDPEELYK